MAELETPPDVEAPAMNEHDGPSMAEVVPVKKRRLICLDITRGFAILGMMLVDNQGNGDFVYKQLSEDAWNMRLADIRFCFMIFPLFMFVMGVATPFALKRAHYRDGKTWRKVARRLIILFLIGLVLNAAGGRFRLRHHLRIMGVLQRLAVCYALCASTFVLCPVWGQRVVTVAFAAIYACVMFWTDVPHCGRGHFDEPCNAAGYVDRMILSERFMLHAGSPPTDPEGIISTFSACVTCFLGIEAGRIVVAGRSKDKETLLKTGSAGHTETSDAYTSVNPPAFPVSGDGSDLNDRLLVGGTPEGWYGAVATETKDDGSDRDWHTNPVVRGDRVASEARPVWNMDQSHRFILLRWCALGIGCFVSAWLWSYTGMPLNKKLWTLGWATFTAGIGVVILLVIYVVYEMWLPQVQRVGVQRIFAGIRDPFIWYGKNPILIFTGMVMLEIILMDWMVKVEHRDGSHINAWQSIYWHVFQSWIKPKKLASLVVSLVHAGLWLAVAYVLQRKGIFLKV